MKLSVLILTKNEEENISDCLRSVSQLTDEMIIVDAESSDKTVEIGQKEGAKVFIHPFSDFADQRNFALSKAESEWVLYVDADERVTSELVSSIKCQVLSLKKTNFVAYKIRRKNFYLGNHEWPYVEKLERLFKREKLKGWYGELHESPKVDGEIGELKGFLLHYTHRDLSSMLKKTIEWSKIEAHLRLAAGHPKMTWWRFPRVMTSAFFSSYIKQGGWKVGVVGLIQSIFQSFSVFITYARLWELQHEKNSA
jgi:glycosyltransferase involved in cell wall biosynthesis